MNDGSLEEHTLRFSGDEDALAPARAAVERFRA